MFRHIGTTFFSFFWVVSYFLGSSACGQTPPQPPVAVGSDVSDLQRATLAVQSMQRSYDLQSGLYKTTGWWNSANLITAVADFSRIEQTHVYDYIFSNTLSAAQKKFPRFVNEYYDDEGWWALAWIDVYEHTHDPRYLEAAQYIFRDMSYGWDDTCSGGIWWSKDRKYKNAIANELFLTVAAELGEHASSPSQRNEYLVWANKEWKWFSHSGMINRDNLVNDGLDDKCLNNGRTTWTYNQGVVLGGLTALYRLDHDASLLPSADKIAQAALSTLVDKQGVLHDVCEPRCGADGTQFKGIFVRNLRALTLVSVQASSYRKFMVLNASSIWTQAEAPDYRLGQAWAAPFGTADASTQGSALDALVAAASQTKPK